MNSYLDVRNSDYEALSASNGTGLGNALENAYSTLSIGNKAKHQTEQLHEKENQQQRQRQQQRQQQQQNITIHQSFPDTSKDKSQTLSLSKNQVAAYILLTIVITAILAAGITAGIMFYVQVQRQARDNTTDCSYLTTSTRYSEYNSLSPTAMTSASGCPQNFTYSAKTNLCYKVVLQVANWNDSHQVCRKQHPNATLIIFDNVEQQEAVNESVYNMNFTDFAKCYYGSGSSLYTSGQRTDKNCTAGLYNFAWKPDLDLPFINVPGNLRNLSWVPGEPNCDGGVETCVTVWVEKQFGLNDKNCNTPACSICQIRV